MNNKDTRYLSAIRFQNRLNRSPCCNGFTKSSVRSKPVWKPALRLSKRPALLLRSRRMVLQPGDVGVVGGGILVGDVAVEHQGRRGAAVAPVMRLRMPVRKGEAARKTMVAARQIVETIGAGLVGPPAHAHRAIADVNA